MKNRIISQICLALILLCTILFYAGRERFPGMGPSFLEQEYEEGGQVVFTGILLGTEESDRSRGLRLGELSGFKKPGRKEQILVWLSYHSAERIPETGQKVTVSGTLHFYQNAPNPGNFDQKFYYQKQRIYGYLSKAEILCVTGKADVRKTVLEDIRERLGTQMEKNAGEKYGGILRAMLLGERKAADEGSRELYQKSGISHLLAISGLHVSFFGMGLYRILRKLTLPRWAAALAGSLVLAAYVAMTGASVSARRALLMFLVRMGAEVTGRVYDGVTSLSLAALAILLEQPLWLFDAGFLMSFGSVAGLYLLTPLLAGGQTGIFSKLAPPVAVNLVLLPLVLYYYFEYPLWSLAWNLAVIPLASVVFASGLLGAAAGVLVPAVPGQYLAAALGFPAKVLLWFYEAGSRLTLKLPLARLVPGKPEVWKLILYVLLAGAGIALLLAAGETAGEKNKEKAGRRARTVSACCLLGGCLVLLFPALPDGKLSVVMLDVGQGDCLFIQTPDGKRMLVDGGSSTQKETGRYQIEPFLKYQGAAELDYVFVTHGDTDHISGIRELLERREWGITIRRLVLPPGQVWEEELEELAGLARKENTRVFVMEQEDRLAFEEVSLTCLWPEAAYQGENGNPASLVLSLRYGKFSMLLTGDLEGEGEQKMLEYLEEKEENPAGWTVLKCGHHGSKNATGEAFLQRVRPSLAFLSAGAGNLYGHPSPEVLERLEKWECTIYNTIECHATGLKTDGQTLSVWTKERTAD